MEIILTDEQIFWHLFVLHATRVTIVELSRKYWYFQATDKLATPSSVGPCISVSLADKGTVMRNGGKFERTLPHFFRVEEIY